MRKYRVFLKAGVCDAGVPSQLEVEADDVNLDSAEDGDVATAFWNFTTTKDGEEDALTVAVFPMGTVAYIVTTS